MPVYREEGPDLVHFVSGIDLPELDLEKEGLYFKFGSFEAVGHICVPIEKRILGFHVNSCMRVMIIHDDRIVISGTKYFELAKKLASAYEEFRGDASYKVKIFVKSDRWTDWQPTD